MDVVWDVRLAKPIVWAGEWTFFYGFLYDKKGDQLMEQFVWLRINNIMTKGYVTEYNKFRFYVRFRDPGLYILQPFLYINRIIVDGPRVSVTVLPRINDMEKPFEVRYFKKICLDDIKPTLRRAYSLIKFRFPRAKLYVRGGIVNKKCSYHDIDFLVAGVPEKDAQAIEKILRFHPASSVKNTSNTLSATM